MDNRAKERIGINKVANVVEIQWRSGWQEYAAHNDDAVDGVILMRKGEKKPTDTGGVVFVQVKCGAAGYRADQAQYPNHICVKLGREYISKHKPRWDSVPGPMVLVFVDETVSEQNPPAWWVDLRSDCISPTNEGIIRIPLTQRFSHHSKGDFHRLCGPGPSDRNLPTLKLTNVELVQIDLGRKESIRNDAWKFYKDWRDSTDGYVHATAGRIYINRVGWKHITRRGRSPHRILSSWMLLGAAKQMILRDVPHSYLGHASVTSLESGSTRIVDYLGLRANIIFPYRHEAVVQCVLKRNRLVDARFTSSERQKVWFYSVYEPRRGMRLQQ